MPEASQERQRVEQAAGREAFVANVRRYREQRAHQRAASLAGYLCEVCLDAPAVQLQPAPWGGDMGVCRTCASGAPEEEDPGAYVWPN